MSSTMYPQYMHSQQPNAPQMTGGEGSEGQILQVLDAALITGMCPNTVAEATLGDHEITLDFGVLHGYQALQFIDIKGGSSPLINKSHRLLKVTGTTVTIAKGEITDVSGVLTTLLTPLGWESMFGYADTSKRAYRSTVPDSNKDILFLDCAYSTTAGYNAVSPFRGAKVNVCSSMEVLGVQGGSSTQNYNLGGDGQMHWFQSVLTTFKGKTNGITNTPWVIVGDGKFFYFLVGWGSNGAYTTTLEEKAIYGFGELPKISENDIYNTVVLYSDVRPDTYTSTIWNSFAGAFIPTLYLWNATPTGIAYSRDLTGSIPMESVKLLGITGEPAESSGEVSGQTDSSSGFVTIHPLTLGFTLSSISLKRLNSMTLGGVLPYLHFICGDVTSFGTTLDRTLMHGSLIVRCASSNASSASHVYFGHVAFDLVSGRQKDNTL